MKRRRAPFPLLSLLLCAIGSPLVVAQVTDLKIIKSGNDAQLQWTTGDFPYTVSLSNTDPTFKQEQTLSVGLGSGPFTYAGGLTNNKPLQFFQVCDSVENCVAFAYTGGAVPPPLPQVGSVSPSTGLKVGDVLTINGSGFSTLPTQNLVLFPQGITVASNASPAPTETQFQVTIPRGAVSGSARVQVGYQLSDPLSLTVNTQTGFTHIYGASFQPITTDVWLTDGGSGSTNVSKLYSMTYNSGTGVWDKTARETASNGTIKYLGGQGMDSGGYYYYGLYNTSANGGVRRAQTNPPGSGGSFTQVMGNGDTVQVVALATSPAFTNTVFVAYSDITSGVKGVKELGAIVNNNYGGFLSTGPNLAAIAGLALDSSGNLYLSATTQIIKITSSTTYTTLCSGFNRAEGISLYQSGPADAGTLLVVDNGTSTLYSVNLNDSTPSPHVVLSGLSVPRTATFALTPLAPSICSSSLATKLPSSSGLSNKLLALILAIEDTQPRQIASSPITLEPQDPVSVWISKQRSDDPYPSSYQSGDHQVTVTATVVPVPNPPKTVYFRVADQPDSAPYASQALVGTWCDNQDLSTTNDHAKLWDTGTSSWQDVASIQTDATTGKAITFLNTSDRDAGDNYVVQASFDNWSASNTTPTTAQTGVITNRRRVYIEKDSMFVKGGMLYDDAIAGDTYIVLYKNADNTRWDNLSAEDEIAIFDTANPYEGPHDEAYVGGITDNYGSGPPYQVLVSLMTAPTGGTPYSLCHTYTHSPVDPTTYWPTFQVVTLPAGTCAAVGAIGGGFYDADLGNVWQPYDDAFVEYWLPLDGAGAVPYLSELVPFYAKGTGGGIESANRFSFEQLWDKNWGKANSIYLMGGKGQPFAGVNLTAGITDAANRFSYIYPYTISTWGESQTPPFTPSQTTATIQWGTQHELGHEYWLNRCSDLTCGAQTGLGHHDARSWWNYSDSDCPNSDPCLEDYTFPSPPYGVDHFCVRDLFFGDPNCSGDLLQRSTIRYQLDPLPSY